MIRKTLQVIYPTLLYTASAIGLTALLFFHSFISKDAETLLDNPEPPQAQEALFAPLS